MYLIWNMVLDFRVWQRLTFAYANKQMLAEMWHIFKNIKIPNIWI